ncbi:MAG: trypsin-like peptidase domain-containing protein [Planctomycetota bacterium]
MVRNRFVALTATPLASGVRFTAGLLFASRLLLGAGGIAAAQDAVLLDFSTPGCSPCRQMDPVVSRLQQEGWAIRQVSTATEPHLAQRFGVDRYPTFVLVAGGREVRRASGVQSYESLRQWLAEANARVPRPRHAAAVSAVTFAEPAATGESFQVGSDLGPAPEVTIPGAAPAPARSQPEPRAAAAPRSSIAGPSAGQLLNATVRLKVKDQGGSSFGTGTIIDARQGEALVLTCGHLFREAPGGGGREPAIAVELFQAAGGQAVVAETTAGQVLSVDLERDIALVTIRPRGVPSVAPVAAARSAARVGEPVWTVGCDRGADPTIRASSVTTTDRYKKPPSLTATGAPVVGRSGGGLFNARGEVVGVCFGAYEPDNEGFYAKLSSIHGELDKLGLSGIYSPGEPMLLASAAATTPPPSPAAAPTQPPSTLPAAPDMVSVRPPRDSPVVRGQDSFPRALPPGVTAAELAALEELSHRAAVSEVVCVIRPKEAGGKSEVITLDRVSPAFLQALKSMRGADPAR